MNDDIKSLAFQKMRRDIDRIKNDMDYLEDKVKYVLDELDNKQFEVSKIRIPHRCPVCNGAMMDNTGVCCNICDGRGIVWG